MNRPVDDAELKDAFHQLAAEVDGSSFHRELGEKCAAKRKGHRRGRRVSAWAIGATVVVLLVALGFGVNALVQHLGQDEPVVVITDDPMQPAASGTITDTTSRVPAGDPVQIQRFDQGIVPWKSWIDGDTVVWMQSAGAAARTGLAYSASPGWDTVFATASVGTGGVQEIAEVRLSAPKIPDTTPWGLTLPLAWAEVLPGSAEVPFKLVWAAPPETLAETYLFHGLFSWSPGEETQELLPESSLSLRAQASGDAIAIPVPATSYSETNDDAFDPVNWARLLMMTANMSAPIEVDPKAPQLPESALVGLSPYFSLLTDESGPEVTTFDLRTGEKLSLGYPSSYYPHPIIAGHYAAWWTETGDVYLADLDAESVETVLALGSDENSQPVVALGKEWLVVLKPWSSFDRDSALVDPSQHPGADLIALHLPDLQRVDIPAVIPKGQVGSVQISGNTVLLTVSPAIAPMPHNEPDWVALQTLRLNLDLAGTVTPTVVGDGAYDLRIDRKGGSEDPTKAFEFLPEARYQPIENGPTYRVVISEQGSRVSVEGKRGTTHQIAVRGKRTSTTDEQVWYELTNAFAGGRFVVWRSADGWQAELTLYGSGRPIIFSERGALVRDTSLSSSLATSSTSMLDQETETARAEATLHEFLQAWAAKDGASGHGGAAD